MRLALIVPRVNSAGRLTPGLLLVWPWFKCGWLVGPRGRPFTAAQAGACVSRRGHREVVELAALAANLLQRRVTLLVKSILSDERQGNP